MAVAPDSALWIVDAVNARYTVLRAAAPTMTRRPVTRYRLPWLGGFAGRDFHDGFVRAGNDVEFLLRVRPDGVPRDTVAVIRRDAARASLDETQRDSLQRYIVTLQAEVGVTVTDAMRPRQLPVLHWFFADDEGRVWIKVFEPGRRPRLDVFDAGARNLASVELPFEITEGVPLVRGGKLFAVVEGADGAPQLIRARIRRS